jgi:hypothetical protein
MEYEKPIRFIALAIVSFTIVFTGMLLGDYFSVPFLWLLIITGGILVIMGMMFAKAF